MAKIKICSINQSFYDMFDETAELEKNNKRPCLIVLKLKYKGKAYDFAIPFRSNIYQNAKRSEYFPLPPRSTTKKHKKHGLHYTKMFPIKKMYINSYYTDNSENKNDIAKIEKNINKIINEAQKYLDDYVNGIKPNFAVNIDVILLKAFDENITTFDEVAVTKIKKEL